MTDSTTMPNWYEFALYRRYKNHPWQNRRHLSDVKEREAHAVAKREASLTTPFYNKRSSPTVGTRAEKVRDPRSVPKTERPR